MTRFSTLQPGLVAVLAMMVAGCAGASPGPSPSPTPARPAPTVAPTAATPTTIASPQTQATAASLPPDGTWQVELTVAELEAAGWPADVTPSGTYTWTFEDGRAIIALDADDGSGVHCEADLAPLDDGFRLTYDDGECGGEVDDVRWELEDDGLHLFLITTNAPFDQQKAYLETETWQSLDEVN